MSFNHLQSLAKAPRVGKDPRIPLVHNSQRTRWGVTRGGKGVLYALEPDIDESRYKIDTEEQAIEDKYHCDEMLKIVKRKKTVSNHQTGEKILGVKPPSVERLKIRQTKNRLQRKEKIVSDLSITEGARPAFNDVNIQSVLSLVNCMTEKYEGNIQVIERLSAENVDIERRIKTLEDELNKR